MSQRTEKVQRLAREVLGEEIQNLKDPRLGFATVTAVRITPDLRLARVFVSVLGSDEEKESTMVALKSATPVLRTELGQQVRMKYTPELVFELDTGADEAQRLEEILHRIEAEPTADGEDQQ
ncbi:MAG: 30S ribosome-binding factor RbfA [Actinobacteria bacterium]|nr:30S ribosome-binding factor RbfA [Actinomycetota bacterium]